MAKISLEGYVLYPGQAFHRQNAIDELRVQNCKTHETIHVSKKQWIQLIVGINFQELQLIEVIIIKYVLKVIRHEIRIQGQSTMKKETF